MDQYKSKHAEFTRLIDKMDAPIRDIEIRSMWQGLAYTDLKYTKKLKIISEKYYISVKVVEHALNEIPKVK